MQAGGRVLPARSWTLTRAVIAESMIRDITARPDSVRVTPDDLARALEALQQQLLKPDDVSKQRIEHLERLFEGDSEKALVVGWRLEAMSIVVALGKLPPGADLESPVGPRKATPLIVAAATEPLLFANGEPRFDAARFEKSVLAIVVACYPCLNSF